MDGGVSYRILSPSSTRFSLSFPLTSTKLTRGQRVLSMEMALHFFRSQMVFVVMVLGKMESPVFK